ncbi:EamA family transporter [Arthrobacter glacialis]|uniref:EamA family transporter n=1 Tax=Arthrobacter glacialis TaxID=1664 RepID=UPI001FAEC414|nr:EamA family transporter [Arthrobacter glacialis]
MTNAVPQTPPRRPFILASACLQTTYLLLLTTSYKHGAFSQIYPLDRGLAVFLVAVIAVTLLALTLIGDGGSKKGALFAVMTGISIAAYTLVDGLGVRQSGNPLSYISWLFLLQGLILPSVCLLMAPARRVHVRAVGKHWKIGSLGGVLSMLAYGMVVVAQSVAPLALVSALRESSVLLAGVIGVLFIGERFSKTRLGLTTAAVAGIAALQLG